MMNTVKKIFVLMLMAAVVSLGLVGCKGKDKSEHPTGEEPAKEAPAKEAPDAEHPK